MILARLRAHSAALAFAIALLFFATAAPARFLQTDPVGYDDQINLYTYVNNDPVNLVDPDGKEIGSYDSSGRYHLPGENPEGDTSKAAIAAAGFAAPFAVLAAPEIAAVGSRLLHGLFGRAAASSFADVKSVVSSRFMLGESTKGRTTNFIGDGGRRGAERLFRELTGWGRRSLDQGKTVVNRLKDGTNVNIRTRTLKDGTLRTTVETQRSPQLGTRIPERIKVRFDDTIN